MILDTCIFRVNDGVILCESRIRQAMPEDEFNELRKQRNKVLKGLTNRRMTKNDASINTVIMESQRKN